MEHTHNSGNDGPRRTLFVSPHLDDAVLSCAARIRAQSQGGTRVVVATLFSDGTREYAQRRREDEQAISGLGATHRHLGLLDAPDRLGLNLRFSDLCFGPAPSAGDISAARMALEPVIRDVAPDEVWFPLAIGGHVDHRVAFACHGLAPRARFYFERPYSFVPILKGLRLFELGLGAPPTADEIDRAFEADDLLRRLVHPKDRERCRERAHKFRLAEAVGGMSLAIEGQEWPANIAAAGARAIRCYQSQLPWIFGSEEVAATYARYMGAQAGGWREYAARIEL